MPVAARDLAWLLRHDRLMDVTITATKVTCLTASYKSALVHEVVHGAHTIMAMAAQGLLCIEGDVKSSLQPICTPYALVSGCCALLLLKYRVHASSSHMRKQHFPIM